ncbi:MAG: hypothetical protein VX798_08640 [Bacteroidota bacterium]|uniref:Cytoplasmic protein n=1 Tax=Flagellimonas profundi TaxID=2915620 RepID=A0ABS3FE20_9FLAO|nr:hypothetical protein [Allomuricauda profundi]MBO0341352.1 hypothetical protein [Allomuricauda profundi]MEC7771237.1 hypothetical protein [Bacteroidota bacterium]
MKYVLSIPLLFFCGNLFAQTSVTAETGKKVIIDNDKMQVIEHVSTSNGDVCGKGMHHHAPHLTVVLSDAKVRITPEKGKSQVVEVSAGTSIWFESETHSAINLSKQPTKMLLVYLKD